MLLCIRIEGKRKLRVGPAFKQLFNSSKVSMTPETSWENQIQLEGGHPSCPYMGPPPTGHTQGTHPTPLSPKLQSPCPTAPYLPPLERKASTEQGLISQFPMWTNWHMLNKSIWWSRKRYEHVFFKRKSEVQTGNQLQWGTDTLGVCFIP